MYEIQVCKSHEFHSRPTSWETVTRGPEAEIVKSWWKSYAGVHPAGDQYRVVDSDGEEQMLDTKSIIGPLYS